MSIGALCDFSTTAVHALMAAIPQNPGLLPLGCEIIARFRFPKVTSSSFSRMLVSPPKTQRLIMRSADPLAGNQVQDLINGIVSAMNGVQGPNGLVYGDWVEWEESLWYWGSDPNMS